MIVLLTERLRLRPMVESDCGELCRIANDPDVSKWMENLPHPYLTRHAMKFLEQAQGRHFLIIDRSNLQVAGSMDFRANGEHVSIGYWIGSEYQGKGYGFEALKTLVAHLFLDLEFTSISAGVMKENRPSASVLRKSGFELTGETSCNPVSGCGEVPADLFTMTRSRFDDLYVTAGCALPFPVRELPTVLVSAVALIDADGRILLAKRPEGKSMAGLWEFPGGKIEAGETPEAALKRELHEELGISTELSCFAPLTFASHSYEDFHLLMPVFACRTYEGTPQGKEGQTLKWVPINKLRDYPMPEADVPLVALIQDYL